MMSIINDMPRVTTFPRDQQKLFVGGLGCRGSLRVKWSYKPMSCDRENV